VTAGWARVLSVLAAGCASPKAASDRPKPQERPIQAAPLEVRLLEAGSAPRESARYQIEPGNSGTVIVDLADTMRLSVGEMSPPEVHAPLIRLTMKFSAHDIDVAGRIALEGTITKVEVPSAPDVAAGVTAAVASDIEALSGTTFRALVSGRGYLERLTLPTPGGATPQLATTVERLRQSLRHLWPPLPGEPFGPGAEWAAHWRGPFGPVTVDEWASYSLKARDGNQLQLAISLSVSAGQQKMNVLGAPPGATVSLTALRGTGTGKAEVQLTRVVQSGELIWTTNATGVARPVGEPPSAVHLDTSTALLVRPAN